MDDYRARIAAKIIKGATVHRVAAKLLNDAKRHSNIYRLVAALQLQAIYKMPLENAVAVVSEMDGEQNGGEIVIDT